MRDPCAELIRTPRLRLRLLAEQDRAEFLRVHEVSRSIFEQWMPARAPGEALDEMFEKSLHRTISERESETAYRLVAVLEDGRIAGLFNLFQIVRESFQSAMAGWRVSADVMGRGLGTEGVGAMLDFAFAPSPAGLGLHRVAASIIPHNLASIRVAEKNGFRREGLSMKYLKIAGQWQDHLLYAKLAEEHTIRWIAS